LARRSAALVCLDATDAQGRRINNDKAQRDTLKMAPAYHE
jgi:hypothetical protein